VTRDVIQSLTYASGHRRRQLRDVLTEAEATLTDLYEIFEARDFGDDEVHDPNELDERETTASETSAKLLARLIHLLTADNLSDQTTALSVAQFAETGTFTPKEN
jgi:hypothetical protein